MRNKITTEELIRERFSKEKADEIIKEADKEVQEIKWGGSRKNSGRKTVIKGKVLKFTKRLTEKEAMFIDYAREHNFDYDKLMEM